MFNKPYFFVILMVILVGSFVYAESIGVTSPYSQDNPLKIVPGGNQDFSFLVQNGKSNSVTVEVSLSDGSEVVSFVGDNKYDIPAGGSAKVNLRAVIPNDVEVGKEYPLTVIFKEVSGNSEGDTVNFANNLQFSFPIIVGDEVAVPVSETTTSGSNFWTWVIFILTLIVLIIFIWMFFKKRKNKIKNR